jgi:hypothetical protein
MQRVTRKVTNRLDVTLLLLLLPLMMVWMVVMVDA